MNTQPYAELHVETDYLMTYFASKFTISWNTTQSICMLYAYKLISA